MISTTIASSVQSGGKSYVFSAFQIVMGSLFIALCAQISISLPFTMVNFTLQTLGVMLVGAFMGSHKGFLCVLAYLTESMLGFPVLHGGHANPLALLGPHAGYLAGFVLQAYMVGWISERRHILANPILFAGILLSCALQLGVGTLWIGQFVGYSSAFMIGFMPFIVGEFLKTLVVVNFIYRNDCTSGR